MKKYFKPGILVLVLVVPALLFLFLKFFGQNHYNVRTYFPVSVDSVKVTGSVRLDTVFHEIPPFKFTSQDGEPVTNETFKDDIYVVDFIFTKCPNVCPKMTSQMTRVQDAFENNDEVKILSHTVDPKNDSAEVLNDYAAEYRAKKGKWYFVTGAKKELYDIARNGYYVTAVEGDGGKTDFIHTEKFVLVDQNRHIRGYYNSLDPEEIDRLIVEIKVLLYEKNRSK